MPRAPQSLVKVLNIQGLGTALAKVGELCDGGAVDDTLCRAL